MRLDKESRARLAKTYHFAEWKKPVSSMVLSASAVSAAQVQGYELLSTRRLQTGEAIVRHHLLWAPSGEAQPAVSTQVFEASNPGRGGELMLYLLGQFEGPLLQPTRPAISEVAFSSRGHRLVIFQRQNLVIVVSNIGDKPNDLSRFAGSLSEALALDGEKSGGHQRDRTERSPGRSRRKTAKGPGGHSDLA